MTEEPKKEWTEKLLDNGEILTKFPRRCHCGPKMRTGEPGGVCAVCDGLIPDRKKPEEKKK